MEDNNSHWSFIPATENVCALYVWKYYVISCRPKHNTFTLSYRPPDEHIHINNFANLGEAMEAAENHDTNFSHE